MQPLIACQCDRCELKTQPSIACRGSEAPGYHRSSPGGPPVPSRPVSLRHGRPMVAIPGPSVVPDRVLSAMHRAMPNIYDGELIDISLSVFEDLATLVRTSGSAFVAAANGHG